MAPFPAHSCASRDAKAKVVAPVLRSIPAPSRRPAIARVAAPGPAAKDPGLRFRNTQRVSGWCRLVVIRVIPIGAPFRNDSQHIVSPGVRPISKLISNSLSPDRSPLLATANRTSALGYCSVTLTLPEKGRRNGRISGCNGKAVPPVRRDPVSTGVIELQGERLHLAGLHLLEPARFEILKPLDLIVYAVV